MPNNLIPLGEGAQMTALYRQNKETILAEAYRDRGVLPICETFDREAFDLLLSNAEVKGVRIYACMDADLNQKFIAVGVSENDEDIFIYPDPGQPGDAYVIEKGSRCPDDCPPDSALNS